MKRVDFDPCTLKNLLIEDLSSVPDSYVIGKYASDVLLNSITKKYIPDDSSLLHCEAMDDFVRRNEQISNLNVTPIHRRRLLDTWKATLERVFNSGPLQTNVLTLNRCLDFGYAGPGASIGTKHTDFFQKMFSSQLSTTSWSLYHHYVNNISERWLEAEHARLSRYSVLHVVGSKLTSVPKDASKNRTICIEPSLNMFYQLGAKEIINGLLKQHYNIDVSSQPQVNRLMAYTGSIHGAFATLDLTNASDSISLELCRHVLPPNVFSVLDKIRSKNFTIGSETHEFNMISSMGNGFTFSLMTLLFSSLLEAFAIHRDVRLFNGVNMAVFGDDIILPSSLYKDFVELLHDFGFEPNLTKSFHEGHFRESCGEDYYYGHNVRGIYIKKVKNETDVYAAFNRLHNWSVKYNIPLLRTLQYLLDIPEFRAVPLHSGVDEGFIIPAQHCGLLPDKQGLFRYKSMFNRPARYEVGPVMSTHPGALIAFIGGYFAGNTCVTRSHSPRYQVIKRATPSWDYSDDPVFNFKVRDLSISWLKLLSRS